MQVCSPVEEASATVTAHERTDTHVNFCVHLHSLCASRIFVAVGELDLHAAANWDKFYQQNKTNFFKDRHYLDREFPELSTGSPTILEVWCS